MNIDHIFFVKREEIEEEANNYETLGFFKKSKNDLIIFITVLYVLGVTLGMTFLQPELDFPWKGGEFATALFTPHIADIIIYSVVMVFVYLNHRWAIALLTIMYLASKVLFIIGGLSSVPQLFFGFIATMAAYRALRVATQLKNNKKLAQ